MLKGKKIDFSKLYPDQEVQSTNGVLRGYSVSSTHISFIVEVVDSGEDYIYIPGIIIEDFRQITDDGRLMTFNLKGGRRFYVIL